MNIAKRTITQFGKKIISVIESVLFTKTQEFISTTEFPWTRELEINFEKILAEYQAFYIKNNIPYFDDISSSQKQIVEKNKWKSLILLVFNKQNPIYKESFRSTNSLVLSIPNVTSAMFSVLKKDTHIRPHRGIYKGLLRCHLGLIIPDKKEECYLMVNQKIKNWETGKCFVFDDTFEHEAFNKSERERVILLIDFLRPTNSKWKFYANKFILFLISKSPLITEITDIYKKK